MREPLPTLNHLIDPNRREIKPIYDGIPVGTIRSVFISPPEYCACEHPEPEERIYEVYQAKYMACKRCNLDIRKTNGKTERI